MKVTMTTQWPLSMLVLMVTVETQGDCTLKPSSMRRGTDMISQGSRKGYIMKLARSHQTAMHDRGIEIVLLTCLL